MPLTDRLDQEQKVGGCQDAVRVWRAKENAMSYDIRIAVKLDKIDKFVNIGVPEYDSPTYNLRDMFVACMDWDYNQG